MPRLSGPLGHVLVMSEFSAIRIVCDSCVDSAVIGFTTTSIRSTRYIIPVDGPDIRDIG